MRMTPVQIETLLHCYYRCDPLEDTPAVKVAIDLLLRDALITTTPNNPGYRCTAKGSKYVEMICETPYPVEGRDWVDPRTAG